jgi:Fe-S-cluster containining protein
MHEEIYRLKPLPIRRRGLVRQTPFSFSCMCCLQCCRSKKIQVNPYEIARLASNLGISTTQCIVGYTTENGSYLKFDDEDRCIFLGSNGCRVHPDRPLVCRLYPLGRHCNNRGEEWFSEIEPEAGCQGEYDGGKDAVENWLDNQEVHIYLHAADSYLKLLWEMMAILEQSDDDEERTDESDRSEGEENSIFENGEWLDMDAAVKIYCGKEHIPFPMDIEDKMRMHQDALQFWIQHS